MTFHLFPGLEAMPVTPCGAVRQCKLEPKYYGESTGFGRRSEVWTGKQAVRILEEARAKDVATHEANKEAIAHNRHVRSVITAVMLAAGVPDSYSERDTKSRSRFPKSIKREAGYLGDLQRNLPVSDGFGDSSLAYDRLKPTYDAYLAKAEADAEALRTAADRAAAAAVEARKANLELAKIVLRYELPEESDWPDVLEALRKRDQRLDLAVAMQITRGNWNDGYYRVSDAIKRFTIQDDQDKAIVNDILGCFGDDIDGRVFRDTTWSYSRLFAEAADQQLSADIQLALSKGSYD